MSASRVKDRHPSVQALLSHFNEKLPKPLIRRLAQEKVSQAKKMGWSGPAFCPLKLCSFFGIRCFEVQHNIDGDGRILLGANGRPRIEFATGRMKERQVFTIFHEFAHTLFPDYCEFLPLNHNGNHIDPEEKEFEGLCDVAAAEMLFPVEEFTADLKSLSRLHFPELLRIQERYRGSLDATCYRMADLASSVPLTFAFMTDQRGQFSGTGPLWVRHSSGNKLFKGYITPGVRPPKDSVAKTCYFEEMQSVGPSKETWWLNGSPRSFMAEAVRLPKVNNPDYPKIVVILLPLSYKGGGICL